MDFLKEIGSKYKETWQNIISPPRQQYDLSDLGPRVQTFQDTVVIRNDIELKNNRGEILQCSFYSPDKYHRKNGGCVIYLHGNGGSRVEAVNCLSFLLPRTTVFSYDFAGAGKSQGQFVTLGVREADDLTVIVEYIKKQLGISTIALWGRSMGAVTAIHFCANRKQTGCIVALALDSGFTKLSVLLEEIGREITPIPGILVDAALILIKKKITSVLDNLDIFEIDYAQEIRSISTDSPIHFSCSHRDSIIPPWHTEKLYEGFQGEKKLLKFDGDHNSPRPHSFYTSVAAFLEEKLYRNDIQKVTEFQASKLWMQPTICSDYFLPQNYGIKFLTESQKISSYQNSSQTSQITYLKSRNQDIKQNHSKETIFSDKIPDKCSPQSMSLGRGTIGKKVHQFQDCNIFILDYRDIQLFTVTQEVKKCSMIRSSNQRIQPNQGSSLMYRISTIDEGKKDIIEEDEENVQVNEKPQNFQGSSMFTESYHSQDNNQNKYYPESIPTPIPSFQIPSEYQNKTVQNPQISLIRSLQAVDGSHFNNNNAFSQQCIFTLENIDGEENDILPDKLQKIEEFKVKSQEFGTQQLMSLSSTPSVEQIAIYPHILLKSVNKEKPQEGQDQNIPCEKPHIVQQNLFTSSQDLNSNLNLQIASHKYNKELNCQSINNPFQNNLKPQQSFSCSILKSKQFIFPNQQQEKLVENDSNLQGQLINQHIHQFPNHNSNSRFSHQKVSSKQTQQNYQFLKLSQQKEMQHQPQNLISLQLQQQQQQLQIQLLQQQLQDKIQKLQSEQNFQNQQNEHYQYQYNQHIQQLPFQYLDYQDQNQNKCYPTFLQSQNYQPQIQEQLQRHPQIRYPQNNLFQKQIKKSNQNLEVSTLYQQSRKDKNNDDPRILFPIYNEIKFIPNTTSSGSNVQIEQYPINLSSFHSQVLTSLQEPQFPISRDTRQSLGSTIFQDQQILQIQNPPSPFPKSLSLGQRQHITIAPKFTLSPSGQSGEVQTERQIRILSQQQSS